MFCSSPTESASPAPVFCSSPAESASPALYDEVLSLAFRIRQLEPWEDLDDSDVYAIRMQDGYEIYVVTMGNGGESYDIQLYDGAEDFQTYLLFTKGNNLPEFELLDAHTWASYKSVMGTYELDTLRLYINKVKKEVTLPQRIITDNPRTEALFKDFCQQLGIILEYKRTRIPQLTNACQFIYDMQ